MRAAARHALVQHGAIVLLLAIGVRVWVGIDALDAPFWQIPTMDEIAYLQMSARVLEGQPPEYGAWYMTPGYAWWLAALVKIGADLPHLKLLQMAMGVLSAWLLFLLGRRAFDVRVGLIAGALWAIAPAALMHELLLLKPAMTVLLSLIALWAVLRREGGVGWWCAAGLALGGAVLLRGELLAVGVGLALAGVIAKHRSAAIAPGSVGGPVALVALLLAVVAIPTAQNFANGGGFVPLAFGGGPNFYIGNHAGADGSYLPLRPDRADALFEAADAVQIARESTGTPLDAAGVSRFWWNEGVQWWRSDPGAALALTARKAVLLWSAWEGNDVISLEQGGRWITALRNPVVRPFLLLPLALAGIALVRDPGRRWPLLVFLAASWSALVPFFVFERFRLPMIAVASLFAAAALVAAFDAWRQRRRTSVIAAALGTVLVGLLLALPRIDRDDEVLRVNIGSMLMQLERWDEALVEFEAVRRTAPDAGRIDVNIGTALQGLGRYEEAVAALARALDHLYAEARATGRPPLQEIGYCHELAGDLERKLSRPDRARAHYDAILRLVPQHERVRAKRDALGS